MRSASFGVVVAVGGLALGHCGGNTTPGDNPDFDPPAAAIGRYDERFGPRLHVDGGEARFGSIYLARWGNDDRLSQIGVIHPGSCMACSCIASFVSVHSFLLMAYEVTTDAWRACMADGACEAPDVVLRGTNWDAPERGRVPVAVTYEAARQFCRHYGGDLPTPGQWNRAAHGERLDTYGVAGVMEQVAACGAPGKPPCSEVIDPDAWDTLLIPSQEPVGSHAWDVGPFGHHDLYGAAAEWVRFYRALPPEDCTLVPESTFSKGSEAPLNWYALRPQSLWSEQVLRVKPPPYKAQCSDMPSSAVDPPARVGFRCAFPEGAP